MPSAGESKSPKASLVAAIDLTQKSINLNDSLADSHALLGYLYTLTRQHDKAIAQGESGPWSLSPIPACRTYGWDPASITMEEQRRPWQ